MLTVTIFRQRLQEAGVERVIEEFILAKPAAHVTAEQHNYIHETVTSLYRVPDESTEICITGSAKLGFSFSEKKVRQQVVAPRWRPYGPESDIDVAVISSAIFKQLWLQLAEHAYKQPTYYPWRSERLGDYMVCGWLRPDHFPKNVRLSKCDDWSDCFRGLSGQPSMGRRKVNGGLFYSLEHLVLYQRRSLNECLVAEGLAQ